MLPDLFSENSISVMLSGLLQEKESAGHYLSCHSPISKITQMRLKLTNKTILDISGWLVQESPANNQICTCSNT